MAVYAGATECKVIYVAKNGRQLRVSSVWVGDQQVFPPSGQGGFILRVGVSSGVAYAPLREWAVSIGKTYMTITEITVPMKVVGPSLDSLLYGCSSLVSIPALDTSQVTNMRTMFYNCQALTTIPALDTSKVTDMVSMFSGCASLTSIPALDTSKVTTMANMFARCASLTTIPAMDTSKVTNMASMFARCASLTSVPALDCSALASGFPISGMFSECARLESVTLPGMGKAFTAKQTLDMKGTKLNTAAANALMQSLGTPAPGGTLQLPATAAGANTSIATAKNWQVTIA